mgnify:CR=1 FL=1
MAITKVSTELLKDNSVTINKLHSDTVVTVSKGLHNHMNDNNVPTSPKTNKIPFSCGNVI